MYADVEGINYNSGFSKLEKQRFDLIVMNHLLNLLYTYTMFTIV